MHPKLLTPADCASIGFLSRGMAICETNMLTRALDEQHDVIKIDGLWYAYNRVKHHPEKKKRA
jgi:hypothetical protein